MIELPEGVRLAPLQGAIYLRLRREPERWFTRRDLGAKVNDRDLDVLVRKGLAISRDNPEQGYGIPTRQFRHA